MALQAPDLVALSRLLDEALDLDAAAREHWLAALPDAHAALRPMLRKLLAESPAPAASTPTPTDPAWKLALRVTPEPKLPHAGERIGPYRLLGEIGRGGMGTVWRAERADGVFERQVALKLPHASFVDTGLAQRVARERAVLAGLAHPNIAQLYDAGWSDSGRPYLALEFVEGKPIDAWCSEGKPPVRERVRLFLGVVRAVAYAHAHLVIHRDIKPANVMVTRDGQPKLLDFGVAKLLSDEAAEAGDTELTRLSGRPLTPNYAAPEQVLGEPVSTATDLYSLGVVLYELLVGKSPYRVPTKTRRALEEAVLTQDAVPPSSTAIDPALARALRGDLDAIVLKALKKRPEDRYETAAAFAEDLERYLAGRAVRAQRDSLGYRARRFIGRNRMAVGASVALACAIAVGAGATLWQATRAREQAAAASASANFVLAMIQRADPRWSQFTRAEDRALLVAADERVERDLADQPALQVKMRTAIATAYRNRGDGETAANVLRRTLDYATGIVPARNLDFLAARVMVADLMAASAEAARGRRLDAVLRDLDATIETLLALGNTGLPLLVDAFAARTTLRDAAESNDPLRAAAELRETLMFSAARLGPGDEHTLRVARRLAATLGNVPALDNEGALAVLAPVIVAAQRDGAVAETHPDLIEAQALRGRLLCALARCDEGLALLQRMQAIARTAHGVRSETYRRVLRETSLGQWYANDLPQAIGAQASAYALLAADQPFASEARAGEGLMLARHLLVAHRPADAEPFIEEAEASLQAVPDPVERERRARWITLRRAWLLFEFGDHAQAQRVLGPVLAKARAEGNTSVVTVAMRMKESADGWVARGSYVGKPSLPAERRVAEVVRKQVLVPEVAAALGRDSSLRPE